MTTKSIPETLELHLGQHASSSSRRRAARVRVAWTAALVALDLLLAGVILTLAGSAARLPVFSGPLADGPRLSHTQILVLSLLAPVAIALAGAYHPRRAHIGRLAAVGLAGGWAAAIVAGAMGSGMNVVQLAVAAVALPLAWSSCRIAVAAAQASERVLIIGSGKVTERIEGLCRRHPEKGFQVVGFVDQEPFAMSESEAPCLGTIDDLAAVLVDHGIDRIIVAWSMASDERIVDILRDCDHHGVEVDTVPRMFDLIGTSPQVSSIGGVSLVGVRSLRSSVAKRAAKRSLDIAGALALIALFAPVALICALAILVSDGRPIFFRQERVGARGRLFRIVKFRTMRPGAEQAGVDKIDAVETGELSIEEAVERIKSETASQVTGVGNVLRVTSLDELPQLWNVLKGDMSLVGPRPLRDFEVDALGDWQLRRQDVRPGITGLWQVMGRSDISWTERMQLDYAYARHWSMSSDMGILLRTVGAVLQRKGSV